MDLQARCGVAMNTGDLVEWSLTWLAGGDLSEERVDFYRKQIGVLIKRVEEPPGCWFVVWCNGIAGNVHKDYMEAL